MKNGLRLLWAKRQSSQQKLTGRRGVTHLALNRTEKRRRAPLWFTELPARAIPGSALDARKEGC
jgi:DNA-binding Xre family transcriptional regulator